MIPGSGRIIRMEPAVRCARGGVDHATFFTQPLKSSLESTTFRIWRGRELDFRVRCVVGEVDKKRLFRIRRMLIDNPFFRTCSE